jgi:hypothetical protein
MTFELAIAYDADNTFDPYESPAVIREYVCAVCHGQLVEYYVPGDRRVVVACPDHGNVAQSGRVMVSSVSIEMERAKRQFSTAIRNLPDLWGELIPPKRSDKEILAELGF